MVIAQFKTSFTIDVRHAQPSRAVKTRSNNQSISQSVSDFNLDNMGATQDCSEMTLRQTGSNRNINH